MPLSGGGTAGTPADNSVGTTQLADIATTTILGRVTAGTGDPEVLSRAQALAVLDIESVDDSLNVGCNIFDTAPAAGTITVLGYAPFPFTITSLKQRKTASGTVTVNVKINGVSVTGLSAVAVTSTPGDTAATANNVVATGDAITVTYSDVSSPVNFSATLFGARS